MGRTEQTLAFCNHLKIVLSSTPKRKARTCLVNPGSRFASSRQRFLFSSLSALRIAFNPPPITISTPELFGCDALRIFLEEDNPRTAGIH